MRLFIGIWVPYWPSLESALDSLKRLQGWRVVSKDRLHLTIQFLGEVPDQEMNQVRDGLTRAAEKTGSFSLEIHGSGRFGNKIVWAGAKEGESELIALAAAVVSEMKLLGLEPDKPFRSHLTLARAARRGKVVLPSNWMDTYDQTRWGAFEVTQFDLISSVLGPGGPIYTTEHAFHLRV